VGSGPGGSGCDTDLWGHQPRTGWETLPVPAAAEPPVGGRDDWLHTYAAELAVEIEHQFEDLTVEIEHEKSPVSLPRAHTGWHKSPPLSPRRRWAHPPKVD
jgi:hypothetical protein